jgi:hypothetical protein
VGQAPIGKTLALEIPHARSIDVAEAAIVEVTGASEQNVAVTSLPDPKRGERLCVVYTDLGMPPEDFIDSGCSTLAFQSTGGR